jgi:hypothetical protein
LHFDVFDRSNNFLRIFGTNFNPTTRAVAFFLFEQLSSDSRCTWA